MEIVSTNPNQSSFLEKKNNLDELKMLKNNFNFELVTNVVSGKNSISGIYQFLEEKNYKKIGLVLDNNLYKNSNYIKFFLKQFKKKLPAFERDFSILKKKLPLRAFLLCVKGLSRFSCYFVCFLPGLCPGT